MTAPPDLARDPRTVSARSRPVTRSVVFATSPGSCETLEGSVPYETDDAIVTGDQGERWPIGLSHFLATYRPAAGTVPGKDGLYLKQASEVLALQLAETTEIAVQQDQGVLVGQRGDWLVDYGNGSLGIIRSDIFSRTYDIIDAKRDRSA